MSAFSKRRAAHGAGAGVLAAMVSLALLVPATPAAAAGTNSDGDVALLTTTSAANARISRLVPNRLRDPVLGGNVAVRIYDTKTDKTLFTRKANRSFRVASNTKLVTAATALEALGPGHQFPTSVVLGRGRTVYIVGGGDPLLTSGNLQSLASSAAGALRARGIKNVKVRLDESLFAPWRFPSGFDYRCPNGPRGYCITPVHALTFDRRHGADNGGDAARYFTSRLNAASKVSATYAGRGQAPRTPVGVVGPSGAAGPTMLARYSGHRLDVSIRAMLFISDDEIAELLFRHVAVATGHTPSQTGARKAQRSVLRGLGVPLDGVVTSSGSGRSRHDRFTAIAMIKLLRVGINGDHPRMAALRDGTAATGGLPLLMRAGIDGTLSTAYGRYNGPPTACVRGKAYAKTGTLGDAITFSGYARGADKRWKVFSILVNSRPTAYSSLATRNHVDRVVATIVGCF